MDKNYIKMCEEAEEIQRIKYTRSFENFDEYMYLKGDMLEQRGRIFENNIEWVTTVNTSIYSYGRTLIWLPTFDQLLKLYSDDDFSNILRFSNFLQIHMTANHEYGLIFNQKEMIALHWIMETVYGVKSNWYIDFHGEFKGGWIREA